MRAPTFWKNKNIIAGMLRPLARVYGWLATRRQNNITPLRLSVPVICIGNLVAGGAGKTPVALALGALLKVQGKNPHYLSRGYKGTLSGPVQVDLARHTAREVGDEPLLLAQLLPTWIAKDRAAGGKVAEDAGADIIIMDDGFQNPSLHKDISFLVIDGEYGLGNEYLLPAGPLREPISAAMERAQAILLIGEDVHGVLRYVPASKPILTAKIVPDIAPDALKDKPVVAFAGIARPRKFYRTLQHLGCSVRKMVAYPDHHCFTARDIAFLRAKAKEHEAMLVTTTKDYVRLPPDMQEEVTAVPVTAIFDDVAALRAILS